MPKHIITRNNWGRTYTALPKLDFLAIQRDSYKWYLDNAIGDILKEISPVDDFTEKNWSLSLDSYRLGKPGNTPTEAINKGITFDAPLYVEATLLNKKTG